MLRSKNKNDCKSFRTRLVDFFGDRFTLDTPWINRHLINCPHCRRRLTGYSRLSLGLTLLKSQQHHLDLLSRANQQALGRLKHSLRHSPAAEKLRKMKPELSLFKRLIHASHSVSHAAACLAIIIIIRCGVLHSMDEFQKEGSKAVKQYYAHHLGDDLADDIFHT